MQKLSIPTAALLTAAMLSALPAQASGYTDSSEIALDLKATSAPEGVYIADDNTVYLSPTAARTGVTLPCSVFVEADKCMVSAVSLLLQSDCDSITFCEDSYISAVTAGSEAAYALPDGSTFTTDKKPYCFGTFTSDGKYDPQAFWYSPNFMTDYNAFKLMYMRSGGDLTAFLGGQSDWFSFTDVDLTIAPGTETGTHRIQFLTIDPTRPTQEDPATVITSDISVDATPRYSKVTPTMKGLDILVPDAPVLLGEARGFRYADETEPFRAADLSAQVLWDYDGSFAPVSLAAAGYTPEMSAASPADLHVTAPQTVDTVLTAEGSSLPGTYCIGLKGDADMDGVVSVDDATAVLRYVTRKLFDADAQISAGTDWDEDFVYFLADTVGNSTNAGADGSAVDTTDASEILRCVVEQLFG